MDRNYILAFEDCPLISINFRIGDTRVEAQRLDRKRKEGWPHYVDSNRMCYFGFFSSARLVLIIKGTLFDWKEHLMPFTLVVLFSVKPIQMQILLTFKAQLWRPFLSQQLALPYTLPTTLQPLKGKFLHLLL